MKGSIYIQLAMTVMFISIFTTVNGQVEEAEPHPLADLNWIYGPTEAELANKAKLHIPEGYAFLGIEDTDKFMEYLQNIPTGNEYTLILPDEISFANFGFNPIGYVKDDEEIDADAIMETLKSSNELANIEKKKRGWSTISITGWSFRPQYDQLARLLEWAILGKDDQTSEPIVNYKTRILGRGGVMEVTLVTPPESLDISVTELKTVMQGFEYLPGNKYAEYRDGDHVAEYGLAALIAGGAAAAVVKSGAGKSIMKFIIAGIIALFAGIGAIFKRNS